MWQVGDWAWSQTHQQYVKVIETAGLWDQQFYRVWIQQQNVVLKLLGTDLCNQPVRPIVTTDSLCYLSTAAKIANVQQEGSKEFDILPQDLAVESSLDQSIYALMHKVAQKEGKAIFESMLIANQTDLDNQFEKGEYSFNARKKAIERVGLPEVRQFRLRQLRSEYALWLQDIDKKRRVFPDMVLHTIIEIKG
ncbi:TPA: hypothetical protein ACXP16_005189 [Klebsiella variicola subsp. variicola]|uniref:hypothetical protein n=1 Tax=Klebsiella TaxID=570 RepID=UPI0007CC6029|nr:MULTISPECIES: hypothetical protein [Klebsiella]EKZ9703845.1 hypothetical protein [Klebsiella pneumoniae]SBM35860.1 Uncharacterised protein [Klebsiella pneumoniae]HDU4135745.1 hypothetical protein [Klebsiella pneumoniae subsp. pneumoniae]